jgi:hypothetical protein
MCFCMRLNARVKGSRSRGSVDLEPLAFCTWLNAHVKRGRSRESVGLKPHAFVSG